MAHDPLFWLYAEIRILRKRIAALEKPIVPSTVTLSLEMSNDETGKQYEYGCDETLAVSPAELVLSAEALDDDDVRSIDNSKQFSEIIADDAKCKTDVDNHVSLLDEWKADIDKKFVILDKWKADVDLVNTETMKKILEILKEFNNCMEMTNKHKREISRVQAKMDHAMDSIGELCHSHHGLQNEVDDIRENMDELTRSFARGKGVKGRQRQPG